MELTSQGIADMEGIAIRLKSKFKSYFDEFEKKFLVSFMYLATCNNSTRRETDQIITKFSLFNLDSDYLQT